MAAVGRLAVWTQSGVTGPPSSWTSDTTNSHLPFIKQKDNVALIMYNPDTTHRMALAMADIDNFDVTLQWPSSDEWNVQQQVGDWFLGRQWGGYIAVRSHCGNLVCSENQQTWAVIVGNAEMYGNFDKFTDAIKNSTYQQKSRGGWIQQRYYYGKITVETPKGTVTIEHSWY